MSIRLQVRACKKCGTEFKQKVITQSYCSRRCYDLYYKEKDRVDSYPTYRCQNCRRETRLDYDPVKEYRKLENFICPICKQPRKIEEEV